MSLQAKEQNWFILRDEQQFGPYAYAEMIQLLQQNQIFDFDFAWAPHLEAWKRIAELPEFNSAHLALVVKEDNGAVFERRKMPRAKVNKEVYVIDANKYWEGTIVSLSEGGALLLSKNPFTLPGEQLTIHFKSFDSTPAFNVTAVVVAKKYTNEKINVNSSLQYVVRFLQPQEETVKVIKQWVLEKLNTEETRNGTTQVYK